MLKVSDLKKKRIGIIGGNGGMGRWFTRFFTEHGMGVRIADLDTPLRNEELARSCDVVILSTPMGVAVELARTIGPLLTEEQLFMDFSSLKTEVIAAMKGATRAEVLGVHPMFGQYTEGMKGQNVILTPGKGEGWIFAFQELFAGAEAVVSVMDPEVHDRHMAFVQSVTHLVTIATGQYMKEAGMDSATALSVATPIFRLNVDFVGRLFALDLGLYEDLVARNPYGKEVAERFCEVLGASAQTLMEAPALEKRAFMEGVRDFLGEFRHAALTESNRILDGMARERK